MQTQQNILTRFPWMTAGLVLANVGAFFAVRALIEHHESLVMRLIVDPSQMKSAFSSFAQFGTAAQSAFASLFLNLSWRQLIVNSLEVVLGGILVELCLGKMAVFSAYIFGGLAGIAAHLMSGYGAMGVFSGSASDALLAALAVLVFAGRVGHGHGWKVVVVLLAAIVFTGDFWLPAPIDPRSWGMLGGTCGGALVAAFSLLCSRRTEQDTLA